ncbi:MAG: hypothetical protein L0H24_14825 [Microlunatus sp.]|nr:hypothetical protein [Microlunatus sp.]
MVGEAALLPLIRALGVPVATTRTASLRQPVLQAPAPVVAKALGFHYVMTHRHNFETGGTWKTYAPRGPRTVISTRAST